MTDWLQNHQKSATAVVILAAAAVVFFLFILSRNGSSPAASAAYKAQTDAGQAGGDTASGSGAGGAGSADIKQADVSMLTGDESAPSWRLENTLYLDINGDGAQEAVVLVRGDGGNRPLDWRVYGMKDGRPVELFERTRVAQGELSVKGSMLVESEGIYAAGDRECCPSSARRTYYVWKGDGLVVSRIEATPPGATP
ncbi:MAG: hypothetical protein M1455_09300 [Actinobacteria bacterium]|nr:hypothetical protein [Actinomycetota bacterium]